jgi:hypothetical protein
MNTHYYEFMQIEDLDLNGVAETVGVDFEKSVRLNADQRVGIAVSGVSESVRRIDRFQGIGGRENTGVWFGTWDTKKTASGVQKNPLANLIKFFPDGGEAIYERQNGMHGFVIYNANRELVRAGDTELVNDYLVPGAHDKAIRPSISCIRCHGPHQGLWDAPNHIKALFDAGEVDITGDEEANARIAGQYLGNFDTRIELARTHYQTAVRKVTVSPQLELGLTVEEVSTQISKIYGDYVYNTVTPQQAALELGFDDASALKDQVKTTAYRNVTMSLLRINVPVRRESWEEIYASARLLSLGEVP